ncbi:MAG: crossover junction endodeoxyribonuclease RuvC [Candidatus Roizmanbacteria bacterium]|nr:crossover junction endodeoxyribonuclease RuvC [Candidatus Roizmanbacteria bacterium]
MRSETIRVIGIDPGFDRMGIAIIERSKEKKEKLLWSACVESSRTLSFEDRLVVLANEFERVLQEYVPSILSIEKIFFTKNQRTGIAVAEARGMLRYLARKHTLSIMEYTPQEIKQSVTGYGNADKKQVAHMVSLLLTLPPARRHDDEYDAIAAGLTALGHLR